MENTQKNNIDCPSPYNRPMAHQYPSQSANFIPFDTPENKKFNNPSRTHSWNKNKPKFYRNNNEVSTDSPRSFASPSSQVKYETQRKRPFNTNNQFRDNPKKQFDPTKTEYEFSSYYHPSMLQDPWRNLMQRYEALSSSKISLKK